MHTHTPCSFSTHLLRALALVAGLICILTPAAAQPPLPSLDESAGGTYFLVAFPDTTTNQLDSRYPNTRVRAEASIWIFSAVKNKVKITSNGGASTTLTMDAGKFKIYQIPTAAVVDAINTPVSKSFKIEADFPVVVYCYFAHIQGLEAWTPIPVEFWGTQYYAACMPGEVVKEIGVAGEGFVPHTPKPGPAEILVIAAYDNTLVTLTPPPGTEFVDGGLHTVALNEGECYQVQSRVDVVGNVRQEDIGSTVIASDKPIGVISGNTRAQFVRDTIGLKENAYKNLAIEWLRPAEQYGREFVYMPTWDAHRPETTATAPRSREFVRIHAGGEGPRLHGSYTARDSASQTIRTTSFEIKRDTLAQFPFSPHDAVHFITDRPAQAMMHSAAIMKYMGSAGCSHGIPCVSYSAWAPYMTELTPREQWTTFAPYYAPPNPGGMRHYINVVTDSASAGRIVREDGTPFPFDRRVPGTSLVWGSTAVSTGQDHWLMGKDGARFAGYVYGIVQGSEEIRYLHARKRKDDAIASAGEDAGAPAPLRPAEYEEYNALSYGYPLVSRGNFTRPADSVVIDTTHDCSSITIKARITNAIPVGFRSVTLDQQSTVNAKLTMVDPQRSGDVIGRSSITMRVSPIDPGKRAFAVVLITDRAGNVRSVPVEIESFAPAFPDGNRVLFENVVYNVATERTVTLTNLHSYPITVSSIGLAYEGRGFTIAGTNPDGPARPTPTPVDLAPGASMTITLRLLADSSGRYRVYADSLVIRTGCYRSALSVSSSVSEPDIVTHDLDFSTIIEPGMQRTLWVKVCNNGPGWATFVNPTNGPLLEWRDGAFSVPDSALDRLRGLMLGQGMCDSLPVTFSPQGKGDYQVTARFWGNTRNSRDTSVWRARVTGPSGVDDARDRDEGMFQVSSNGAVARIRYTLEKRCAVRIELYDGAGAHVATLFEGEAHAGGSELLWSAAGHPSGIYFCTITTGASRRTAPLIIAR